jgi:hypothetical protein
MNFSWMLEIESKGAVACAQEIGARSKSTRCIASELRRPRVCVDLEVWTPWRQDAEVLAPARGEQVPVVIVYVVIDGGHQHAVYF